MSNRPIVQLQHVSRRFRADRQGAGDHVAVNDVSLEILAGEFFALLGPSGCGKTTLLRSIAGLELPDSGQILIDGVDVSFDPPNRRPVNLVFQHYALFPHLTVEQNVMFGLRYQGIAGAEARRRAAEVLERVQLHGLARRRPDQLSGGQKQRVALARALVLQPKVLLLDEPLSALDQKLRRQMQVELKHLQRTLGITFIFVTHDQEEALIMSDRIGVMNAGRLEQVGPAVDVYERPTTEFVARFMGAENFFCRDGHWFVVRPEKLRLTAAGLADHGPRRQSVVVEDRLYQGLSTAVLVRDAQGTSYTVTTQNGTSGNADSAHEACLAVGSAAVISWLPDDEVPIVRSLPPGDGQEVP